jgi:hypothetical protein
LILKVGTNILFFRFDGKKYPRASYKTSEKITWWILNLLICLLFVVKLTGVIAQLFKAGEGECSVIMLWSYALSALSLTLWSTFYMWLLQ